MIRQYLPPIYFGLLVIFAGCHEDTAMDYAEQEAEALKEGYEWAAKRKLNDTSLCRMDESHPAAHAYTQGCEMYVQKHQPEPESMDVFEEERRAMEASRPAPGPYDAEYGYEWSKRHGAATPEDCEANRESSAWVNGCIASVKERHGW